MVDETSLGSDAFDGCSRGCRKSGRHTRESGCEFAPPPSPPMPVLPVTFVAEDGILSLRYDPITWEQAAAMVRAGGGECGFQYGHVIEGEWRWEPRGVRYASHQRPWWMGTPEPIVRDFGAAEHADAGAAVWTEIPGDAIRVECFGCGREIGPFKPYWLGVRPGARTRACTDCHAKAENRA